jgi:hypothetical protein
MRPYDPKCYFIIRNPQTFHQLRFYTVFFLFVAKIEFKLHPTPNFINLNFFIHFNRRFVFYHFWFMLNLVLILNTFIEHFAFDNVFIGMQYMDKSIDTITQLSFLISANSKWNLRIRNCK